MTGRTLAVVGLPAPLVVGTGCEVHGVVTGTAGGSRRHFLPVVHIRTRPLVALSAILEDGRKFALSTTHA